MTSPAVRRDPATFTPTGRVVRSPVVLDLFSYFSPVGNDAGFDEYDSDVRASGAAVAGTRAGTTDELGRRAAARAEHRG
jgi:hypothetical protein